MTSSVSSPSAPRLVDDPTQLAAMLERLGAADEIAVDCESDGLHHWRGRLCTAQFAVPDGELWIVDALAVPVAPALAAVLGPDGPRKVLHDLYLDAWLLRDAGLTLGNVADTSVHARFLGLRETGLAALLGARLGVPLDKAFQQHDWSLRPLAPEHAAYLADDVRHLLALHALLDAEARALGIDDAVREETGYALRRAVSDAENARPAYARLKGRQTLDALGRAALRRLADARETVARTRDLPVGRVLPNAALVELARRRPTSLGRLRALVHGGLHDDATLVAWRDAIVAGTADGDVPPDERGWFEVPRCPFDPLTRRRREQALQRWRAAVATERGVDPQAVLPGHCVEALAAIEARAAEDLVDIDGLGALRIERDGAALLACLQTV